MKKIYFFILCSALTIPCTNYGALEDIHITLDNLDEIFYKLTKTRTPSYYDLTNAKSHNELEEVLEQITELINMPTTSTHETPYMRQYRDQMKTILMTVKSKSDALNGARKSYQKSVRSTIQQKVITAVEKEDTNIGKKRYRARGEELMQELHALVQKNNDLRGVIKSRKEKATGVHDKQIYEACILFMGTLNNYIALVMKKAEADFKR